KADHLSTGRALFGDDFSQDLVSANFAVRVFARIPTRDERAALLADHAVGLESIAVTKEHNLPGLDRGRIHGANMQDFAILNGGQHASASRLKAKADAG